MGATGRLPLGKEVPMLVRPWAKQNDNKLAAKGGGDTRWSTPTSGAWSTPSSS
jgi:hypothetical protein